MRLRKINLLILILLILSSVSCKQLVITIHAQTLPITRTFDWNDNAAAEQVTNYTVRLDGIVLGNPTVSEQQVTFTTAGAHVLTVTATNAWGTSTPSTLNVNIVLPSNPGGLNIKP